MGSSGPEPTHRGDGRLQVAPLSRLPCDPSALLRPLHRAFGWSTTIEPLFLDLEAAYDLRRNQYHSTQLLKQLLDERRPEVTRVVGLIDVDLFVPILTYVFGEAQLSGSVAIVSTFRLREPWLEQAVRPQVFQERLTKTVLHELGHTLGLRHCLDPGCVMAAASSIEMLDEKGDDFCLRCAAETRG